MREGADEQAATLSWQVRTALEMGAAGTCVFSLTDEWFTGGHDVRDWAFGVVDRERRPKPAFRAVKRWYASDGCRPCREYPKVSVVICAYNAEPTMEACLDSLRALRYPAYEVVVVDDGSTDRTGAIADRYEGFHVIHQENKGLSAARNVGMAASTGEIVAYTDSDCVVDPDWLHYLVATFLSSGLPAVGGPNLPPPEDSFVASCVAASPGGPLDVLLDDEEAEHIPGCNMAFRREALEEIGGFDPIYRAAGDDVDVCWRLQNRGYRIGFSPAAMVWHFRRNTVKAYIRQQRGYGKAEALLYFSHPHRFNALGQSRWRGRIYGGVSSILLAGAARSSTAASSAAGCSRRSTSRRRACSRTCRSRSSGTRSPWASWPMPSRTAGHAWLGALPLALDVGGVPGRGRSAPASTRAAPASAAARSSRLLTYLGPLLRCLERYRWWARGLSAGGAGQRGLGAAARFPCPGGSAHSPSRSGARMATRRRRSSTVSGQRWRRASTSPWWTRAGATWDLEVHGGALVAGPRDGRHREPRRRAAGPPRQDGPARLARDPDRPHGRAPRRRPRRGASASRCSSRSASGGRRCSPPAPSRVRH